MNRYVSGTRVRSVAHFADASGVSADPTAATFRYRAGTGSVQIIANPNKDAIGDYHFDIDTSGWAGPELLLYTCQWFGTGAIQAVSEPDNFEVEPPAL